MKKINISKFDGHDYQIIKHSVLCEQSKIILELKSRHPESGENKIQVIFNRVEAYSFVMDNLQTIISSLKEKMIDEIIDEFSEEFKEGVHYCWPRTWNTSEDACSEYLRKKNVKGWIINSSYGMSGFIVAKNIEIKTNKDEVDIDSLLDDIENLWINFNRCKASLPAVSDNAERTRCLGTPGFYVNQGFDNIVHVYPTSLTKDKIDKINESGRWLNQNSIIRLYALLDCYNALSEIDPDVEGTEFINLVKLLRNQFAHGSGKFNASKQRHKQIMRKMREVLGISVDGRNDWPMAIDKVLLPLFEGVKKYCRNKFRADK
jgi:hypothetical protein